MSTVRTSYQRAFKALVVQALNSIKKEQQTVMESHMIMPSGSGTWALKVDRSLSPADQEIQLTTSSKYDSNYQALKNLTFGDILDLENSRYNNDFVEIKLLGKGGFASVWQAKNKLDGIEYAIKKVRLRGDRIPDEKEKIFREIKFLARLEHTNVVRYYSSWLEHVNSKQRGEFSQMPSRSSETSESGSFSDESHSANSNVSVANSDNNSDIFRMSFSDDEETKTEDYSGIDFVGDDISAVGGLHSSASISTSYENSHCNFPNSRPNLSGDKHNTETLNLERDWILFIQMQLCHSTLRDYLRRRDANLLTTKKDPLNSIDRHASIELFRGIVRGVTYIHEQGLIHRDLKPGNIFMGIIPDTDGSDNDSWVAADSASFSVKRLVPKIGDFGLVTAVGDRMDSPVDNYSKQNSFNFGSAPAGSSSNSHTISHQRSSSSLSYNSISRTTGVGTITYASPEQLAKPARPYNEKVDIYSLGIIFFELHFPFSTGHERVQVLKNLRNGILPNGFVQRFPKEVAFILWMMAEDPDQRPNAKQIKEFELLAGPIHGEHAELQHRLVESSQRIDSISKENEMLRKRIEELETKLKSCECGGLV